MGNKISMFTSQHYVENVEEHATNVMENLDRMRHKGTTCDVTVKKCDGTTMKAHKIVVSFSEKLLKITSETRDKHQDTSSTPNNEENPNVEKRDDPTCSANTAEVATTEGGITSLRSNSVTSAGDLVKQLNGTDVSIGEIPDSPEPSPKDKEQATTNDKDFTENDDVTKNSGDDATEQDSTDIKTEENTKCMENVTEKANSEHDKEEEKSADDSLPPPLIDALGDLAENDCGKDNNDLGQMIITDKTGLIETAIADTSPTKIPESFDVTIEADGVICPASFEDPLEVLINFFYTSHINITSKNVTKLRVVAQQCDMEDVTMACNEFENVLRTETENLMSNEEKEKAASQFRYQYSDPQMAVKMLEHFEKLRIQSRHADVIVTSPTTTLKFPSHSALLVASSKFFADILNPENSDDNVITTDVTHTGEGTMEIKGPDVNDNIMQCMMSYFYTAKAPVSSANASGLMDTAEILGCRDVIEGCAEFLEGTLSVQQCIEIYHLAEKHDCQKLKNLATNFIRFNFLSVSRANDFMTVTKEWISNIVSSHYVTADFPACDGEYQIFQALKKWVNHDVENRTPEVFEVMRNVRLPLISDNHLINDISTDLLIMEDDELCDRVSGLISGKSSCNFKEEVSMRGDEYVLLIGGSAPVEDETSDERGYTAVAFNDHVTMYDVISGRMHELTCLPETRSLHCALVIDHYVIIAGGFDKYSCITNEVYCLDLSNLTWMTLPHMKVKRSCFVMFCLNDYIYAAGGLTPTGYSNKTERYNRHKMKWEYVAQMPNTYYRHAGCVYHGDLLITGGNEKSTDALKYSPSSDNWQMMKPMKQGRDSHAMATALDKVYVIGGDSKIFTTEEYNSSSECWQMLPNVFFEPVYLSGVTTFNDKIFLIGGWKGDDDAHDDIKCFDSRIEKWLVMSNRLRFPRGSLTATTVRMPNSYFGRTVPMTQKQQP